MSEPLDRLRAAVRNEHFMTFKSVLDGNRLCAGCGETPPCQKIRLLNALDAVESRLEAAQERVAALEGLVRKVAKRPGILHSPRCNSDGWVRGAADTCDCRHFLVVLAESRVALAKPLDVTP